MATNRTSRPLTPLMRAALVDRNWVKYPQAKGLADRGLASYRPWSEHIKGRYTVTLTNAGEAAREAILAPLVPDARVRNTLTGLVGRVVRVERSENFDVVVLLWDGSENETCGSAAYLEIIDEPLPESKPERTLYYKHLVSILRHDDSYVVSEVEARQALDDVISNHWDHGEIEPAGFNGDWFICVNQEMHDRLLLDGEHIGYARGHVSGQKYWIAVAE